MPSLLEEIRLEDADRARVSCPVAYALSTLDEKQRVELEAALADETITHIAIARVLIRHGFKMSAQGKSVGAHRRGSCGCYKR